MSTFARIWVILAPSHLLGYGLLAVVVLHTVDLRPEVMLQHAAVPFVQAAVLAWLAGGFAHRAHLTALGQTLRQPIAAVLAAADVVVLAAFWWPLAEVNLARAVVLLAAVKLLVAAISLVAGSRTRGTRYLVRLLPLALVFTALASNAVNPWLTVVPTWLPSSWPFLLRQGVLLVGLLIVFLGLAGTAQAALEKSDPRAALILGWLAPFFIAAFLGIVLNGTLYSYLREPWIHFISTCLYLGATAALLAAIDLRADPKEELSTSSTADVTPRRQVGIFELWLILTLTSISTLALLQALVAGQWLWGSDTWLLLVLSPLVQTSWMHGASLLRRSTTGPEKPIPARVWLVGLALVEVMTITILWRSGTPWEVTADVARTVLVVYAGLKVALLGAAMVFWGHRLIVGSVTALAGIGGAIVGLFGGSPVLTVAGLTAARAASSPRPSDSRSSHLFSAAVDLMLAPAAVLAVGDILAPGSSMTMCDPLVLSLVAVASTLAATRIKSAV